jgi:hypothetical protein
MKKTYQGSCHCGAVQFECDVDLAAGTTRCNCTFCAKARYWMVFAKGDTFRLLKGAGVLSDYQFTPPKMSAPFLHFQFCSRCGIRPFTKGGFLPEFGSDFHAVNVACLNATDAELATAPIHYADGRNDAWNETAADQRYL